MDSPRKSCKLGDVTSKTDFINSPIDIYDGNWQLGFLENVR